MIMLWVLVGLVVIAIVWAIAASSSGKKPEKTFTYVPPTPEPSYESFKVDKPAAYDWRDSATTSVSNNFGKGGDPSGVSRDSGGLATKSLTVEDEDYKMLKNARPFEPRATNWRT